MHRCTCSKKPSNTLFIKHQKRFIAQVHITWEYLTKQLKTSLMITSQLYLMFPEAMQVQQTIKYGQTSTHTACSNAFHIVMKYFYFRHRELTLTVRFEYMQCARQSAKGVYIPISPYSRKVGRKGWTHLCLNFWQGCMPCQI